MPVFSLLSLRDRSDFLRAHLATEERRVGGREVRVGPATAAADRLDHPLHQGLTLRIAGLLEVIPPLLPLVGVDLTYISGAKPQSLSDHGYTVLKRYC